MKTLTEAPDGWLTMDDLRVALGRTDYIIQNAIRAGKIERVKVLPGYGYGFYVYPPDALTRLRELIAPAAPLAGPDMLSCTEIAKQLGLRRETVVHRLRALGMEPEQLRGRRGAAQAHYPRIAIRLLEDRDLDGDEWITTEEAIYGLGASSSTLLRWCRRRGIEVRLEAGARYGHLVQRGVVQRWRAETGRPPLEKRDMKSGWILASEAARGTGQNGTQLRLWCERRGIAVRREGRRLLVPADAARLWSERGMPGVAMVQRRPKGWLSRKAAAEHLGVGEVTVSRLAARGKIEAANVRGAWFFNPESVASAAREYTETPPPGLVRVPDWSTAVWFKRRGIVPRKYRNPDCPKKQRASYVTATEWQMFEQRERRGGNPWDYRRDHHKLLRNRTGNDHAKNSDISVTKGG